MSIFRSKASTEVIAKSIDFEVTLQQITKASEKRAWLVAISSCLLSALLVVGYLFLLPLKEKVPYLMMADPYTGTSSLTKLTENFQGPDITRNEAINKSNISHYILSRESYDWDLISRRDWVAVHAMSSPTVIKSYQDQYVEGNPSNPDKIYGREKSLRVKIKTIVLLTPDASGNFTAATVRFDRIMINKRSESIESADSFIATLAFEYKSNLKMQEDYRVENPLGFRVEAYRLDPEIAAGSSALKLKEISNSAVSEQQKLLPTTVQ